MKKMTISRSSHSIPNMGIPFSENGFYAILNNDGTTTLDVPEGAKLVHFQFEAGCTYLVSDSAITYSPSTSFQEEIFDINPSVRDVSDVDTLYFKCISTGLISVTFYK